VLCYTLSQRLTLHQLHRKKMNSIRVLKAVYGGNVRMIQRGQDLSLPLEPGQPLSILREPLRENLDGDFALQSGVVGSAHLSHAAFAQLRRDLVVGDGLAYQRLDPTNS